jgi:two-component system, OmpR family, response regulator CpxR
MTSDQPKGDPSMTISQLPGSSLSIFSGAFCRADSVVEEVLSETGLKLITDEDLVMAAVRLSGLSEQVIRRALSLRTSVFDQFTREKERALAYLRLATARLVAEPNLLMTGSLCHLIPREVTHFLKVCIIGDPNFRVSTAASEQGLSKKEAVKLIDRTDLEKAHWVSIIHGINDPWHSSLYDMIIPMAKTSVSEAASFIETYLKKELIKPTEVSRQAVADFLLAAESAVVLTKEGHDAGVSARNGAVSVTINKQVLMLNRLTDEIKTMVGSLPGVSSIEVKVGKAMPKSDIYRKYDFKTPSKILLVDDEREFVQTLSERLILRDMGSAVAYDGQSALEILIDDEPDVLVLDLKMPGLDGIEVLRRVKKIRPEVEVIILTGHGSEDDRKTCMLLGAFAYLHKPVDIDDLSARIREANEAVRQRRTAEGK